MTNNRSCLTLSGNSIRVGGLKGKLAVLPASQSGKDILIGHGLSS